MGSTINPDTVTTRFCIISDTHTQPPLPSTSTSYAYRHPLPSANVLLHAGDITMVGRLAEYTYIEDYQKLSPLPLLAAKLSRRRSNLSRA